METPASSGSRAEEGNPTREGDQRSKGFAAFCVEPFEGLYDDIESEPQSVSRELVYHCCLEATGAMLDFFQSKGVLDKLLEAHGLCRIGDLRDNHPRSTSTPSTAPPENSQPSLLAEIGADGLRPQTINNLTSGSLTRRKPSQKKQLPSIPIDPNLTQSAASTRVIPAFGAPSPIGGQQARALKRRLQSFSSHFSESTNASDASESSTAASAVRKNLTTSTEPAAKPRTPTDVVTTTTGSARPTKRRRVLGIVLSAETKQENFSQLQRSCYRQGCIENGDKFIQTVSKSNGTSRENVQFSESLINSVAWVVHGLMFGDFGYKRIQNIIKDSKKTQKQPVRGETIGQSFDDTIPIELLHFEFSLSEVQDTELPGTYLEIWKTYKAWKLCRNWTELQCSAKVATTHSLATTHSRTALPKARCERKTLREFLEDKGFKPKVGYSLLSCLYDYICSKYNFKNKRQLRVHLFRYRPIETLVEVFGLGVIPFAPMSYIGRLIKAGVVLPAESKTQKPAGAAPSDETDDDPFLPFKRLLRLASEQGQVLEICQRAKVSILDPLLANQPLLTDVKSVRQPNCASAYSLLDLVTAVRDGGSVVELNGEERGDCANISDGEGGGEADGNEAGEYYGVDTASAHFQGYRNGGLDEEDSDLDEF